MMEAEMSGPKTTVKRIDGRSTKSVLILACTLLASMTAAHAATLTYPGPAPCNTTLQSCIDSAAAGDVVEIATSSPIDESPDLNRSLVLRAAGGFMPLLAAPNSILASSTGTTDNDFTIQGITIEDGIILVTHGSTGRLNVSIVGNTILEGFITNPTISIRAGNVNPPVMGDITFSILNNRITVPVASQINGISIDSGNNPTATGVIKGNTIIMQGSDQGAAIDLANGDQTLTADVIGNVISGASYDQGISVFQFSPGGSTTVRILNNLITGQSGNVGAPGAISINGSQGSISFSVLNNTLSGNEDAIRISGRNDLGAAMVGNVENNIIANSTDIGISIDSDFITTVTNRNNLLHNNGSSFFTAGPGTLFQDPQFVGGGDHRLQAFSPAIDTGNNTPGGGLPLTDLEGVNRISGGTVDIGAYEHWAVMPLPVEWLSFDYEAVASPVLSATPSKARPIALGPLASGGNVLRIQLGLGSLSGPADVYFGFAYRGLVILPGMPYPDIHLLGPDDSTFTAAKDGLVAWRTNVASATGSLFGDIPISALPIGLYDLYFLVTPAGTFNAGYLWKTDFFIPLIFLPLL
jgi:hypothetical protein